jgi:hypothetical protein
VVTYGRGADSATVHAVVGKKLLRLDDGMGNFRMEWTDADFLIPAAELILSGVPATPLRRDTIKRVVAGQIQTYEVHPYDKESCWVWADPHQSMMRIHAKFIRSEPMP